MENFRNPSLKQIKIDMTELEKCRNLGEKSEKVRLEIMEKTGHMPQSEDPTKFNQILLNFLLN